MLKIAIGTDVGYKINRKVNNKKWMSLGCQILQGISAKNQEIIKQLQFLPQRLQQLFQVLQLSISYHLSCPCQRGVLI